ncbi:glycosyltransferase family 39 protein [uncultured Sphingomonas sp.]|uniref:glycosyltransferase family 39 protein n=1 Tax=uncultured Sphingomonas sp. TaxID=158754 RepID=UPI0035CA2D67
MRAITRPLPAAVLIGLVAQALFTIRLGTPSTLMFDEVHYVPAARAIMALSHPLNTEHPLLGKTLIAAGIALFGDNAIGWRALSTVAGTATVLGVYGILWRLFGSVRTAATGAVLTIVNGTVFVQARIGMLDGFMAALVVGAVAAMLWGMRERAIVWWTTGSVMLGLAIGVKWAAAPYVAYAGAAFLLLKWRRPDRWPGLSLIPALAILCLASATAYLLTFAPAFFYADRPLTLSTLLPFQSAMYVQQTQVLGAHTYQSDWWSWPLLLRPIWYLYEPADGAQRGVLMVGNPAVMWGGLVALAACGRTFIRERYPHLGGVTALWFGSYAVWAIIPKSLGFFYYYYLPSIWLSVAIAAACHRFAHGRLKDWDETLLIVAGGTFAYFYPIMAAMPLAAADSFRRWTWFDGWV